MEPKNEQLKIPLLGNQPVEKSKNEKDRIQKEKDALREQLEDIEDRVKERRYGHGA